MDLFQLIAEGAVFIALALTLMTLGYRLGYRNGFKDANHKATHFWRLKYFERHGHN